MSPQLHNIARRTLIAALLAGVLPAVAESSGAMPEELALGVAMLTGLVLIVLWLIRAGSMVRSIHFDGGLTAR